MTAQKFSIWDCISTALALGQRALDEVRALARIPGPQGERGLPGKDGIDGFGFDDIEAFHDGDRNVEIRFVRGTQVKSLGFMKFPMMIHRGVFKEGNSYERGDVVTWAGSSWHANNETKDKPGQGSKSWTLIVKCGRDGKDGKDGERGKEGREGPPGRDLTQLGFDGKKY